MNKTTKIFISIFPKIQPTKKFRKAVSLNIHQRHLYERPRHHNTVKELDTETGLYYYGARYLDPKASRWLSGDPAVSEYIPVAPVNEEARKRNGSLPGMGGVFNYVNLHVYHYAGNNPVKLRDPDGREVIISITAKIIGTGRINNFHATGSTSTTFTTVYTYEVTISNTETDDISSFEITRHAYDMREKPTIFTFNPGNDYNGFYIGRIESRNDGTGEAVKIFNQRGRAATFFSSQLNNTNKDGAIFIHIGGFYNNPQRGERYAVSTGCFTINGRDSGWDGINRFIDTIRDYQNILRTRGADDTIKILIEPL